jgi:hypothetical protein
MSVLYSSCARVHVDNGGGGEFLVEDPHSRGGSCMSPSMTTMIQVYAHLVPSPCSGGSRGWGRGGSMGSLCSPPPPLSKILDPSLKSNVYDIAMHSIVLGMWTFLIFSYTVIVLLLFFKLCSIQVKPGWPSPIETQFYLPCIVSPSSDPLPPLPPPLSLFPWSPEPITKPGPDWDIKTNSRKHTSHIPGLLRHQIYY